MKTSCPASNTSSKGLLIAPTRVVVANQTLGQIMSSRFMYLRPLRYTDSEGKKKLTKLEIMAMETKTSCKSTRDYVPGEFWRDGNVLSVMHIASCSCK